MSTLHESDLLSGDTAGVGYLLKDRVVDVDDFVAAVRRVAAGGSAVDAEVVRQLIGRTSRELDRLTPRELDVLELMAEGLSNTGIAERLVISLGAVEKHISNVFAKLARTRDLGASPGPRRADLPRPNGRDLRPRRVQRLTLLGEAATFSLVARRFINFSWAIAPSPESPPMLAASHWRMTTGTRICS